MVNTPKKTPHKVNFIPPYLKASGISLKQTTEVIKPAENSKVVLINRLFTFLTKKTIKPPILVPVIPEIRPMSVTFIKYSTIYPPTL
jgi:glycerol-3-phosphate responsive antiterminator